MFTAAVKLYNFIEMLLYDTVLCTNADKLDIEENAGNRKGKKVRNVQ